MLNIPPRQAAAPRAASRRLRPLRAITLLESLMAATILAIVSTSALLPFSAGTSQALAAVRMQKATAYGQAMMEEILSRPFYGPDGTSNPPGPDTSFEDRRHRYDDVDDFGGFTEQSTGLRNFINQDIIDPDAVGLHRDVTVTYVTFPVQMANDVNSFMLVRVRVMDGNAVLATFHRLVAREY